MHSLLEIKDSDHWIKVYKPKEPEPPDFPKISDNLELWVVKESLLDENGFPLLNLSIVKNDKTLLLSEHNQNQKEKSKNNQDKKMLLIL